MANLLDNESRLIDGALMRMKEATANYKSASATFRDVNKRYKAGELSQDDHLCAYNNMQQAYFSLQNASEAYQLIDKIVSDV